MSAGRGATAPAQGQSARRWPVVRSAVFLAVTSALTAAGACTATGPAPATSGGGATVTAPGSSASPATRPTVGSTWPPPMPTTPLMLPTTRTCAKDMGSTLIDPKVQPGQFTPGGWVPPDPKVFDWDQDGVRDLLVVADNRVVVSWATGEIVVTGVQTEWVTQPSVDDDGVEGYLEGERGKAYGALHVPAAVGDVSGDGLPDLVVSMRGYTSVLLGQGSRTPSGEWSFEQVGRDTLGWRNPPVNPASGSQLVPRPVALVSIIWDLDGNGSLDFRVSKLVSPGSRSGPVEVFYRGIQCNMPP